MCDAEAQRVALERDGASALVELEARRERRRQELGEGLGDVRRHIAQVSLDKHQQKEGDAHHASGGDTDEVVGADEGLPTVAMEVAGVRWHVKLDSGARHAIAVTD
ncbi:hypothetical protein PHMEG_00025687 [Phytophthora megakarya]|uniref:Uncharacterized protein n=1 Tax=Phytophthora megakarya TaxID=4795 RepID=A0A225VB30_9STRA|nr:hypothetical protein PHMEG_00025687 [Phytophthora megakarya]